MRQAHTRNLRNVLKAPVAQVPIKSAGRFQAAKQDIAASVAVHVAQGNPGTVKKGLVGRIALASENIGKSQTGGAPAQQSEPGFAGGRNRQRLPTVTWTCFPLSVRCS